MTTTPETTTIILNGASDDIVEVSGAVTDEFYLVGGGDTLIKVIAPSGESMTFSLGYGQRPGIEWHVGVESTSADTPSWPMRFVPRPSGGYDPAIEVTVPVGVRVEGPQ